MVGNFIGTTVAGTQVRSYTQTLFGIAFKDDVLNNSVYNNVIGGATGYPILHKNSHTGRNYIYDNRIGIALNGAPLPNNKWGMYLQGHDFQIGPGNIFANNASGGIYVEFDPSDRNQITGNSFVNNGGLAIDLAPAGPTTNDVGDADTRPNDGLNHPIITSAAPTATSGTEPAGLLHQVGVGVLSVASARFRA